MGKRPLARATLSFPAALTYQPGVHQVGGEWVCQAGDLVLFSLALLTVYTLPYLSQVRSLGLQAAERKVLQQHGSIFEFLVGLLCVGAWSVILSSVGVYRGAQARNFAEYFFRCIIALNSCSAVLGLVELVWGERTHVWQTVAVFWVFGFTSAGGLRLLVFRCRRRPWSGQAPSRQVARGR